MQNANREGSNRWKINRNLVSTLVAMSLTIGAPAFGQTPLSEKSRLERELDSAEEMCRFQRSSSRCGAPGSPSYDYRCEEEKQRRFDACMFFARSAYKSGLQNIQAEAERRFKHSLQLVAMLEGEIGGEKVFGAGIIVGLMRNSAFIVTANHVVRRGNREAINLKVLLRTNNDRPLEARLDEHFDKSADFAVIVVEGLKEAGIACRQLNFSQLGDLEALSRSADVFPVGNPNGVAWGYPVAPDKVSEVLSDNITFQSSFITAGHSGGALIDDAGLLVGMTLKDAPPFGVARSLTDVMKKLGDWGIPVDLERPEAGKPDKVGSCP